MNIRKIHTQSFRGKFTLYMLIKTSFNLSKSLLSHALDHNQSASDILGHLESANRFEIHKRNGTAGGLYESACRTV
jgi:hypothetical protein